MGAALSHNNAFWISPGFRPIVVFTLCQRSDLITTFRIHNGFENVD